MKRKLVFIIATTGVVAAQAWGLRATLRTIRLIGWRAHLSMTRALIRLCVNLGGKEAAKLMRTICSIVFELSPDPAFFRRMIHYAADASSPPAAQSLRQIGAAVHQQALQHAASDPVLSFAGMFSGGCDA